MFLITHKDGRYSVSNDCRDTALTMLDILCGDTIDKNVEREVFDWVNNAEFNSVYSKGKFTVQCYDDTMWAVDKNGMLVPTKKAYEQASRKLIKDRVHSYVGSLVENIKSNESNKSRNEQHNKNQQVTSLKEVHTWMKSTIQNKRQSRNRVYFDGIWALTVEIDSNGNMRMLASYEYNNRNKCEQGATPVERVQGTSYIRTNFQIKKAVQERAVKIFMIYDDILRGK